MLKINDIKIIIKMCKPSYSDLKSHKRTVLLVTEMGRNYAVLQRGPVPFGRLFYVLPDIPEMQHYGLVKEKMKHQTCAGFEAYHNKESSYLNLFSLSIYMKEL